MITWNYLSSKKYWIFAFPCINLQNNSVSFFTMIHRLWVDALVAIIERKNLEAEARFAKIQKADGVYMRESKISARCAVADRRKSASIGDTSFYFREPRISGFRCVTSILIASHIIWPLIASAPITRGHLPARRTYARKQACTYVCMHAMR